MKIERSNVFEFVNKASLKPDKDYGQNFLIEPDVCLKIVNELCVAQNDYILEIGPGLGSLTHFLVESNETIDAVDIDSRMVDFLKVIYDKSHNFNIYLNDIRKYDVSKYNKIIGNLPYNITTETITYLLLNAQKFEKMVFMIQTEALNRFIDIQGKDYGPVSILLRMVGTPKKLFTVKAGSFYPTPKCTSVVFSIEKNLTLPMEKVTSIYKMVKQLFLNRRKTIYNNLQSYLGDKTKAENILMELQIPFTKRPEELSPSVYIDIYQKIKNNN